MKKMEDMKKIIIRTREEIVQMDQEDPELRNIYFEKYMKARRESGMKNENIMEDNFMKFLVDDIELGF